MSSPVTELIDLAKKYDLDDPEDIFDCHDAAQAGVEIIEQLQQELYAKDSAIIEALSLIEGRSSVIGEVRQLLRDALRTEVEQSNE